MILTKWGPSGVGSLIEPDANQQLVQNTDDFLSFLSDPAGNYLELDLPDLTQRFIHVRALDPASIAQRVRRRLGVPLFAEWPYWYVGGQERTQTISGADVMTFAGGVSVHDAVIVFAGDGTFTHSGLGWTLEISGSSAAVTVDIGARSIVQAGLPAPGLLIRNNRDWGWFTAGSNAVTSNVSCVVTWRDQVN